MSENLLVIGDDITGANDTGVMFADRGFSTILNTDVTSLGDTDFAKAQVFSVSTKSRALFDEAQQLTEKTVFAAIEKNISRIYLKIDSTMRGSVKAQIDGAINAWSTIYPDAKAVVCPAYPIMGRTIEQSNLYVNGTPVNQTPSGKDRICPVLTSNMLELLPGAVGITKNNVEEIKDAIKNSTARIFVIDAKTEEDLAKIAVAIDEIGPSVIPVGSAGLASKIKMTGENNSVKVAPSMNKVLILVSSIHSNSIKQAHEFLSSNYGENCTVLIPANEQISGNDNYLHLLEEQIKLMIKANKQYFMIMSNPAKIEDTSDMTKLSQAIAKNLATLAMLAIDEGNFDTIIVFGGDGASFLLDLAKISELRLHYSIMPGVPLCSVESGKLQNVNIITKSGGFGNQYILNDIIQKGA